MTFIPRRRPGARPALTGGLRTGRTSSGAAAQLVFLAVLAASLADFAAAFCEALADFAWAFWSCLATLAAGAVAVVASAGAAIMLSAAKEAIIMRFIVTILRGCGPDRASPRTRAPRISDRWRAN